MGRDKPKKFGKLGLMGQRNYIRDLADSYGIDQDQFTNDAHGGSRYEDFDDDALRAAVEDRVRNDFDYRTSAQHMDDIEGDGKLSDYVAYQRGAHKLHKKAGNEGKYSSIKDVTGVTNNLVNDAQRLLRDKIDALSTNDDEQTNTSITPDLPDEPYVPSPELVKQAGILADWEEGYGAGGNLSPYKSSFQDMAFNPAEANPYRPTTDVNEFAQNFARNKIDETKSDFQFRPTIA
jgi:hypothetical protein